MPQSVSLQPISDAITDVLESLQDLDDLTPEQEELRDLLVVRLEAVDTVVHALCADARGGGGSYVPVWLSEQFGSAS